MPIIDLQRRLTQVGVIRLGEQRLSKNNKPYPAKLDTFRVTSPTEALIRAVADLYGGEPKPWPDAPGGPQWQVTTGVTQIPVFVLPQTIDPNMEKWGPGFKERHCDGQTEKIRNAPCFCNAEKVQCEAAGRTWVRDGRKHCKPTTRVSVMLADVPSLGTWKVESHGWNAAAELPTLTLAILEQAQRPVPAMLEMRFHEDRRLTFKDGKEELETFKFAVPHLDFGGLGITPRQSLGGGVDAIVQNAVGAGPRPAAIGSAPATGQEQPAEAKRTAKQVIAMVRLCKNIQQLNGLLPAAQAVPAGDPDLEKLKAEWQRKSMTFAPTEPEAPTDPQPPADVVVDAELVDDVDPAAAWNDLLAASPWPSTSELEKRFKAHQGADMIDASGPQLAAFLDAIKSGEVTR